MHIDVTILPHVRVVTYLVIRARIARPERLARKLRNHLTHSMATHPWRWSRLHQMVR